MTAQKLYTDCSHPANVFFKKLPSQSQTSQLRNSTHPFIYKAAEHTAYGASQAVYMNYRCFLSGQIYFDIFIPLFIIEQVAGTL